VSVDSREDNINNINELEEQKSSLTGKCETLPENAAKNVSATAMDDLVKIINAWPSLRTEVRSAIMLLALRVV